MSAEAAKAAFAVVKESMEASGEVQEKKGKVILATVKGCIPRYRKEYREGPSGELQF